MKNSFLEQKQMILYLICSKHFILKLHRRKNG
jgi:hypothetical protein